MNASRNLFEVAASLPLIVAPLFLTAVSACAQRHRNPPPNQVIFNQQRTEIIRQLEAAEEADESNGRDVKVSLARKADSFEQADKAECVIRELVEGYFVPQSELADALAVPPKALSPQEKSDLIRQLRDTIALNDRLEQARLNDFSVIYFDPTPYDAQMRLTAEVIEELNIGEDVHWDTIQEALQVVPNPD